MQCPGNSVHTMDAIAPPTLLGDFVPVYWKALVCRKLARVAVNDQRVLKESRTVDTAKLTPISKVYGETRTHSLRLLSCASVTATLNGVPEATRYMQVGYVVEYEAVDSFCGDCKLV